MTLLEVGVVITVVAVLAALLVPALHKAKIQAGGIYCNNQLKQIATAAKVWEGDNHDFFPMGVSITNGGSMETVETGDVVRSFQVMSNELSTPIILRCPADDARSPGSTFAGLASTNISYFVSPDATNDLNPQMVVFGDCNFELHGMPVKSGLNSFWTNDPVAWQTTRHIQKGIIGLGDGSVQSATSSNLQNYLAQTGLVTNRFAIP